MPYGEYAKCPRCGKIAYGKEEIEKEFGYRKKDSNSKFPQSHCKKCRAEELKNTK